VDLVRLSEGVAALKLPDDFIGKCVDAAKEKRQTHVLIDMHYFHFTRQNKATCICVVLHHPKTDMPTIDVILEPEAMKMRTVIDQIHKEATGQCSSAPAWKEEAGPSPNSEQAQVPEGLRPQNQESQRRMRSNLSTGLKILALSQATIDRFVADATALWNDRTKILRHYCTFQYAGIRDVTVVVILYPGWEDEADLFVKEEMEAMEIALQGHIRPFKPNP